MTSSERIAQHAIEVFGGSAKAPSVLTDVFPGILPVHFTSERVKIDGIYSSIDESTANNKAIRKAIIEGWCAWIPLLVFRANETLPDDALLYSASAALGPCDPTGTADANDEVNYVVPFGTARGRGAALVLCINGPHDITSDENNAAQAGIVFAPAPITGITPLPLATGVAAPQPVIDFWRFAPSSTGGVPWREREARHYAPGGVRIRKGDVLTLSLVVPAARINRQNWVSPDATSPAFAAEIDFKANIMLRGDADTRARG